MASLAAITARGGSKRIPRKNVKPFMGKPMLAYAIEAALGSGVFDEVMVSTDDAEIADVAERFGAKVPFMRSPEMSDDFASTADVLSEVLREYRARGKTFDTLCCVYPCVPFLTPAILSEAAEKFASSGAEALMPAVRYSHPIQRALVVGEGGFARYREPENARARTQDLPPAYHDAGMFYFARVDAFEKYGTLVCPKTLLFEMDEGRVQDIDTPQDWKLAEIKYGILRDV